MNKDKSIKDLKQYNDKIKTQLERENDRLTNELNTCMIERNNFLSRIEKAVEYIMSELVDEWSIKNDGYVDGSDLPVNAITPILDILNGRSDTNVKD